MFNTKDLNFASKYASKCPTMTSSVWTYDIEGWRQQELKCFCIKKQLNPFCIHHLACQNDNMWIEIQLYTVFHYPERTN